MSRSPDHRLAKREHQFTAASSRLSSSATRPLSGEVAGFDIANDINITALDGHDVRRVLTSQTGQTAIADAFARAPRPLLLSEG